MTMKLEYLSNELLFNIFDYMSFGQILHSFQSLNSQFNQLLIIYLRITRHLDFRYMSLHDSNIFDHLQLSNIVNQIISLTASNGDETLLPIEYLFYSNLCFRQFINLKSLSLYHIHLRQMMMEIALEWDHFPHLIHIKLIDCCFPSGDDTNQSLFDRIWNIPKLIRFDFSTRSCETLQKFYPSVISSSLKYISFQNPTQREYLSPDILQNTPNLRCLYIYSYFGGEYATHGILPSLVKLEINEGCLAVRYSTVKTNELKIFLQKLSNLSHLTIESSKMFMDGYQWKDIITNYLPKLKIFRCKMAMDFDNFDDIKKRMYELVCSFESDFWIKDHQWFIRCYVKSLEKQNSYYIVYHTLSDIFATPILGIDYVWSVSTSSYENDYLLSDFVYDSLAKVTSPIEISNQIVHSFERSISFHERISNTFRLNWNGIKRLIRTPQTSSSSSLDIENKISDWANASNLLIELPFERYFSKSIPKLDRLISLQVSFVTKDMNQSDLQVLLDRAANLYSLNIVCYRMPTSKFFLTDMKHLSIRKLGLPDGDSLGTGIFYNLQQCIELSRSPLGKQCEILSIGVQNKECIIYLINEMIKLRLLTVKTYDNYIPNQSSSGEYYDLITWLKLTLPSTIKIVKSDFCGTPHIRLWIR